MRIYFPLFSKILFLFLLLFHHNHHHLTKFFDSRFPISSFSSLPGNMEITHGLFFTIAASLFASFLLSKFLSFVSACEAEYKIYAANRKAAACEFKARRGRSGGLGFIEEAVIVDECDEVIEARVLDEDEERKSVGADTETSTSDSDSSSEADQVFDEIPVRFKSNSDDFDECVGKSGVELGDEWEWEMEGFEKSELEKCFKAAIDFVKSENNAVRVSVLEDDVKLELSWLHKVAIQGPNSEQQSSALKIFGLAKWNARRQVDNMSPEVAMEQYIALLSKCVPNWMKDDTADFEPTQTSDQEFDKVEVVDPNLTSKKEE